MDDAIIVLRGRPTEASRRAQGNAPSLRKQAHLELCAHLGMELVEQGYSFSADEGVIIIRGRADLAPLIQATLAGSGSFDYIKTEIVITSEDVLKTREQASVALRHYKAADQDEIDRILFDE